MELQLARMRQQKICDYLNAEAAITIHRAAEICNTSEATARRDIDALAKKGLIQRTRGGAVLGNDFGHTIVNTEKIKINVEAKNSIAQGALELIHSGDSIFLDSGTTMLCLSRELFRFKHLTVITDNLDVAYQSHLDPTSSMFFLGGLVQKEYGVAEGHITEEIAGRFQVDIAFIGADAVKIDDGIYNGHFAEVGVKTMMMHNSRKAVLLADHSKFQENALIRVAGLEEFDIIITNKELDEQIQRQLRKTVREVMIM